LHTEESRRVQTLLERVQAICYGADYNPEQWDPEVWSEDLRLMQLAGVNIATVGVFSWGSLQPDEQTFTFDWLDSIMDLLAQHQIFVCLGTGTAAQPAWLSQAYPDALPVDEQGLRHEHGNRQNYCPTSPDFRRLARNLARQLALRYGRHPALAIWHVSNEYYGSPCYCERCRARFRSWLQARYQTLDELNRHWNTRFWGHTYTNWEQINPPNKRGETSFQGLSLDWRRFTSDMNLECYLNETEVLRELTPEIPVTTNLMGFFQPLDYFSWAPHMDIIAWDSYPTRTTPPAHLAFWHDLMRGLKHGQPWLLMEQTPSQAQWMAYNSLKRPGMLRLHSYQAVAHGSDAVMYFQWRQSQGAAEMFHGAIVSHAGHEHTRVFRDVAEIGKQLATLEKQTLGTRVPARVALLFSWPNWWNLEYRPSLSQALNYLEEVLHHYQALWEQNIAVDVISPDHEFSGYDLVIAPLLNMVSKRQAEAIERYVEQGGTFITGYFSSIVDEDTRAWLGGYPGPLRRTLGIWVEECDPLEPDMRNQLIAEPGGLLPEGVYDCSTWCDIVHLEGATALARFGSDFYAGHPAITEHRIWRGRAIYIATRPEKRALSSFFTQLLAELGISAPLPVPAGVEVTCRAGKNGPLFFVLNHTEEPVSISLPAPLYVQLLAPGEPPAVPVEQLQLAPRGVAILKA